MGQGDGGAGEGLVGRPVVFVDQEFPGPEGAGVQEDVTQGRWRVLPAPLHDATDLHLAHGQLVAGSQLGEVLTRPQPVPCRFAQGGIAGIKQPGMGLDTAAAHPASQLIKLGQAELVGVLDQDRVHPGDVKAALHDRGAEHQVCFAGVEGHHGALQLAFGHLAVGDQ